MTFSVRLAGPGAATGKSNFMINSLGGRGGGPRGTTVLGGAVAGTLAASCVSGVSWAAAPVTVEFDYVGRPEAFTVPARVCQVRVRAFGAAGGDPLYGSPGGKGSEVSAVLKVTAGQVLTVDVGGAGSGGDSTQNPVVPAHGGYGDGGNAGSYTVGRWPGNGATAAGGGGATTVSAGRSAVIIAGGGGGGAGSFSHRGLAPGGAGGRQGATGGQFDLATAGRGGASGGSGGAGGAGGQPASPGHPAGKPGGAGHGRIGGDGAVGLADPHMGTGGGGGGGARGGGAGGSSSAEGTEGGGGGGGSSMGPAGAVFTTGARSGNGLVQLTYKAGDGCGAGRLVVTKTASRSQVRTGGTVRYVLRARNKGAAALTGTRFTDDLTDVLRHARLAGRPTASAGTVSRQGDQLIWKGNLAAKQTVTLAFTVRTHRPGKMINTVRWAGSPGVARTRTHVVPRHTK
ncbi:hypothetical protein ACIBF1_18505 [Spirillospora sp. NPDC050679]